MILDARMGASSLPENSKNVVHVRMSFCCTFRTPRENSIPWFLQYTQCEINAFRVQPSRLLDAFWEDVRSKIRTRIPPRILPKINWFVLRCWFPKSSQMPIKKGMPKQQNSDSTNYTLQISYKGDNTIPSLVSLWKWKMVPPLSLSYDLFCQVPLCFHHLPQRWHIWDKIMKIKIIMVKLYFW